MARLGIQKMLDRSRKTCVFAIAHGNPKRADSFENGFAQDELQP